MKTKWLFSIIILIIALLGFRSFYLKPAQIEKDDLKGLITISGAWALYPMVIQWAQEFQKLYPHVKIDVSAGGAGKGIADTLAGIVDIGMVSRNIYPQELEKGAWPFAVTKDAVVATISENNPAIESILKNGIKHETLIDIWITGRVKNWDQIIASALPKPINVYTRSDACGAAETWAEYLGKHQEDLTGTGVYGDPGLAEAVLKDNLGIGYNNINYVYDAATKKELKGIKILPIDLNENGMIDKNETFYADRDQMINAISQGQYPSPPARDLYFVCRSKPTQKLIIEFIRWVLTDGQKYVNQTGYIGLSQEKLSEGLNKLSMSNMPN